MMNDAQIVEILSLSAKMNRSAKILNNNMAANNYYYLNIQESSGV